MILIKKIIYIPSSDELIELDFDLTPPAAAEDDEWSSFTVVFAPVAARTITQIKKPEEKSIFSPVNY